VAACLRVGARSHTPRCRVLVVPDHGNSLCLRLWCLHHMLMAEVCSLPLELAYTLAPISMGSCARNNDWACANPLDQDRLWQQIEDSAGGHRGIDKLSRSLQQLSRANQRRFYLTGLAWALFWAWVRLADLHQAVSRSGRLDNTFLVCCSMGIMAGALASAMLTCRMALSSRGLLTMQPILKHAAGLFVIGWVSVVTPSYPGLLGQTDWDHPIELLFDEAYRHLNLNLCVSVGCRSVVAILSTSGQTMIIGALNLIFFSLVACGFVMLPRTRFGSWHGTLLALGLAVVIISRFVLDGLPSETDVFAVLMHYLTSALARCAVPLLALWKMSSSWGLCLNGLAIRSLHNNVLRQSGNENGNSVFV